MLITWKKGSGRGVGKVENKSAFSPPKSVFLTGSVGRESPEQSDPFPTSACRPVHLGTQPHHSLCLSTPRQSFVEWQGCCQMKLEITKDRGYFTSSLPSVAITAVVMLGTFWGKNAEEQDH